MHYPLGSREPEVIMYLSLIRDTATPAYCMGIMKVGALEFQTIERPWVDAPPGLGGHQGLSCVPPGLYEMVKHDTPKHPRSFALVNHSLDVYHEPGDVPADRVPYARTAILIHVANTSAELAGCVALGMHRGVTSVLQSVIAFERFNLTVPWIIGHSISIEYAAGVTP